MLKIDNFKTDLSEYFSNKMKDLHLRELLSGSSTYLIFSIVGLFLNYLFTFLITRNFGAETMGVFAFTITTLAILSTIGTLGFGTAIVRFIAEYGSQNRQDSVREIHTRMSKLAVIFSLILSIVFYFLSPFIARSIFHKEYLTFYFRIISLAIVPMVLININSQSLRAIKKIKAYSFFQDISPSLSACTILIFLLFFTKEQSILFIAYIVGLFASAIACSAMWKKNAPSKELKGSNNVKLKTILRTSIPILLISLTSFFMNWIDIFMLGKFRTEVDIGIYNVASKVASLTTMTLIAINSIAAPKFAEFYGKGDMKGLGRIVKQSTKLIFWTSFPILCLIFITPSLMLGIFGKDFQSGSYALRMLTFGQFINAISGSVGLILLMTAKERVFHKIIMTTAVINFALNYLLIPKYGINGAAFVSMLSTIFWNLTSVFYIKRYLHIITLYIPLFSQRLIGKQKRDF
jgi:O-antigen/teichoic acid export membrane protein